MHLMSGLLQWTFDEQSILFRRALILKQDWEKIAEGIIGHDSESCRKEWERINSKDQSFNPYKTTRTIMKFWTPTEISKLHSFIDAHTVDGKYDAFVDRHNPIWNDVSSCVGRSPYQCYLRWKRSLNPSTVKGPWTNSEKMIIEEAHKKYGNQWRRISALVPGRTSMQVEIYFRENKRNFLGNNFRYSPNIIDALDRLILTGSYRMSDGRISWTKLSKEHFPNIKPVLLRKAWTRYNITGFKNDKWTPEETDKLVKAVNIVQQSNISYQIWRIVANLVPGRTPESCKIKYRYITSQKQKMIPIRRWTTVENLKLINSALMREFRWVEVAMDLHYPYNRCRYKFYDLLTERNTISGYLARDAWSNRKNKHLENFINRDANGSIKIIIKAGKKDKFQLFYRYNCLFSLTHRRTSFRLSHIRLARRACLGVKHQQTHISENFQATNTQCVFGFWNISETGSPLALLDTVKRQIEHRKSNKCVFSNEISITLRLNGLFFWDCTVEREKTMNAARRVTRQTALSNVNDENKLHGQATRIKLTSTQGSEGHAKPWAAATRKRAALGDVSNVNNKENVVAKTKAQSLSTKARVVAKSTIPVLQTKESAQLVQSVQAIETMQLVQSIQPMPLVDPHVEETTKKRRTSKVLKEQKQPVGVEQTQASKKVRVDGLSGTAIDMAVDMAAPPQDWDDLDADDAHDPLMVSEYVEEIMSYMRELEVLTLPLPDYMDRQKELQWKMRGILVDWLIEVHAKFRLLPETLFLSVNIIDRFLSLRVCSLPKLQLVGITALFIAAKYEEVMCPSIKNFIYMADGGYTNEEILKAEQYVLQVLGYDMSYPNPMNFLRRVSKADNYDIQTRTVAKYLIEISLLDHRFLPFVPSNIAASGIYLARIMVTGGDWNANLIHYSGYKESDLIPCSKMMLDYLSRSVVKHEAFFKKYASKKFMKVSLFVRDWVKKHYNIEENVRLNGISLDHDVHEPSEEKHQGVDDDELSYILYYDLDKKNIYLVSEDNHLRLLEGLETMQSIAT
ncbi:hypothetical protein PMAC_002101 [Pneumocystis sp. 'macacae']|nr:hypothetical protein PMAC_002101 [Pneumocystis sp. 'macacae']